MPTRQNRLVLTKRWRPPHLLEGTLVFVLSAAAFYSLQESKLAAIFLFVLAASLRFLGFLMVDGKDGEDGEDGEDGKRKDLMKLVYNADAKKLEPDQEGVLSGALTLLASAIVLTVYIFREEGPLPADQGALRGWEFAAWILVLAHVVLTFVGYLSVAAGEPHSRLGVSSFVLVILSASLGEHALRTGDYKLLVPTIFLYALYDSASRQRF